MGVTTIQRRSAEALREERRQLLARVQMSAKQLKQAARSDALTGEQWAAFERLREISFLLSHADDDSHGS